MRAPLCSDSSELCPEDQGIVSENENRSKIQAIEKSFEKCQSNKTAIFGICLENLMGTAPKVAPQIPFILTRLCRYIEEYGLCCKHLFLEGEEINVVEGLKIEFIESGDAPLEATGNVASVAKLLIIFFEELPEPLIPASAQSDFIQDMEKLSLNTLDCVSHLKYSVRKLPVSVFHVLKYLSRFLLRVSSHKEFNGMSSDTLGIIFGPVIFRLSSADPVILRRVKSVVNYFVQNYHAIFEDDSKNILCEEVIQVVDPNQRRQVPCPSSVMPVLPLLPLTVVIPPDVSKISTNRKSVENVPVLLIERHLDDLPKAKEEKLGNVDSQIVKDINITRKRKERRLSGEDFQPRSSSEERLPSVSLVSPDKIDMMRRCSSNEEMKGRTVVKNTKLDTSAPKDASKNEASALNSFALNLVGNEKNHSPHPPNPKRREVESNFHQQSNFSFIPLPWSQSHQFGTLEEPLEDVSDQFTFEQNFFPKLEANMDCDASEKTDDEISRCDKEDFKDGKKQRFPRSASCPVPKTENSIPDEGNSLSLSWSMLFESEDTEPVRSEHRYSWPLTKEAQEDAALLSPSVQSLRKSNYSEAPLSPSAYRSYLSYRSHHLDPSVPPSPPVEQEDFAKNFATESSPVSDSIKQLTKKIHNIKKRIRKFDERFEADFGYKPSHAEKANHPEAKKLMNDLHKARKVLKSLKEESHLEQVSPASWHTSKLPHILGDSTNQVKDKPKPTVEESFDATLKCLSDERKIANRPSNVDAMTTQEVKDEKLSLQRMLLEFESIHGKPESKEERNTIRPLYDRYRHVKKLLVRSGSFSGAVSKNKDVCTELQPILEHETMDFTSPQHRTDIDFVEKKEPNATESSTPIESMKTTLSLEDGKNSTSHVLSTKYDNSNIHELPLSQMIFQLQQVKSQKRHLRKILREFESEFYRLNGRKVQKEDKAPVDSLYGEYKHVKARLKLLEALISKHDQHQLM